MILIEHATFDETTVKANAGAPEYSYLFVKSAFRPVLERLGTRIDVAEPEREVDAIFHAARARGEDCVFLSFNPPQNTPLGLSCPTVPVFAWEFDKIPDEAWGDEARNDWRHVLRRTGMALTHCSFSAQAVRRSLGEEFPVWVAPAPMFDAFATAAGPGRGESFELPVDGALVLRANQADLSLFRPDRDPKEGYRALRLLERSALRTGLGARILRLEGVVYTSVLAPTDGRKNWRDMVGAFVWAFRRTPTATLVLKLTHASMEDAVAPILRHLSSLGAFECQIILVHGMLSKEAYAQLIEGTTYAVNTSNGEGQCLPLMEYMSAGRPAVAPAHSAMLDYISPENAFVIASHERPTFWPHDERMAIRCRHHQISFQDLVRQYRESYRVARDAPAQYAQMSAAAVEALRAFCSDEVITARLTQMLAWLNTQQASPRRSA